MATIKQQQAVDNLVGNGGNVTKAMLAAGYSKHTANTPQKLTESEGFKEVAQPYLERLTKVRNKILKSLEGKDLAEEKFKDLSEALSKITHDIQLLSGDNTEKIGLTIQISEVIAKKNDINSSTESDSSGHPQVQSS